MKTVDALVEIVIIATKYLTNECLYLMLDELLNTELIKNS